MTIIQLLLVILSTTIIVNRIARFLRREITQSVFKLTAFLIVWLLILVISLFPQTTNYISRKLGLGETLNPLIFAGFVAVFLLIFKLVNIIEKIERNMTEIVREQALKDLETSKK